MAACLIALLIAASLVAIAPQPAHAASANTKACKAYKELLTKTTMKWASGNSVKTKLLRFACQDINKDGVKDLVVYNPRGANATGRYRIYTYASGKLKRVGQYTDIAVCPNNDYYLDTHTNMGHTYYQYYRLDRNGKVIKLAAYEEAAMEYPLYEGGEIVTTYEGDIPIYTYNFKANGKSATADQTMSIIRSLEQGAKKITYVKNTASNRAKHLKAPSVPAKLSATSKTLAPGKTYTLKVKNAGKKSIVWSSSNKKVATVSKAGKVKAKRSGTATITAKVGGKKLTCKITVASHKELAKRSLNGWWHTSSSGGHYMYVKNGKAYLFPTHIDDNGAIINRTSDMKKAKISLTRTTTAPGSSEKRSGYRVRVSGNSYYYYDNDHKLLENRYGAGYLGYSGSSSMGKVNASDVPSSLRQYVKRF